MSDARMVLALVTQKELEDIAEHRREVAYHREQLKPIEDNVMALLKVGAKVQPGRFTAWLSWKRFKAPVWKQIVIARLGEEIAAEARQNAPLVATARLEVTEHPPLTTLSLFD